MADYKPVKQSFFTYEPPGGADTSLPPVIFLHGVISSKETWKDIPQKLADKSRRKVYNVDLRNHGDTEWSDDFDLHILKKDILHFMDTINCQKATIIGHSLGAMPAILLALENSDKVDKLVSVEMKVRKLDPKFVKFSSVYANVAPKSVPDIPKGANEDEAASVIVKAVCNALPPELVKRCMLEKLNKFRIGLREKPDGSFELKANLSNWAEIAKNIEDFLVEPKGTFSGPALFIYGDISPFEIGKEIDHIKGHFPNAQFVEIEGATHDPHHEQPKEFIEALLNFF